MPLVEQPSDNVVKTPLFIGSLSTYYDRFSVIDLGRRKTSTVQFLRLYWKICPQMLFLYFECETYSDHL